MDEICPVRVRSRTPGILFPRRGAGVKKRTKIVTVDRGKGDKAVSVPEGWKLVNTTPAAEPGKIDLVFEQDVDEEGRVLLTQ
jgi:hypothetical protein